MIRHVDLPDRPASGALSAAVVVDRLCFVSGQLAFREDGTFAGGSIEEQTVGCLDSIARILAAAGTAMDQLVSVTVILADIDDWPRFDTAYRAYFGAMRFPARMAFGAGAVPLGALVEIQSIAAMPA